MRAEELLRAEEPERYRLLASLFGELADKSRAGEDGRQRGQSAQMEALSKKVQALNEEKATLNDAVAATKADLQRRESLCDAEQTRAAELQRIVEEQRERLESLQSHLSDAEAQIESRSAEVHKTQVENETLLLKLQRAEGAADDSARVTSLETSKSELAGELERLRTDLQQVRTDKNAEIERLTAELEKAGSGGDSSSEALLADLWQRLASAKPPLVEGQSQPDKKSAERLVDAVVELVTSTHGFEKTMSIFLAKYTKHDPSVKVPWDVFKKRDDLYRTAQQTLKTKGGRPVGLLKLRLRFLFRWTEAAMIGSDSVIESLGSEIESHLRSDIGMGGDPNRKIRDYIRAEGPDLFLQHMRELLSHKLAETYGRGG